MLDVYIAGSMTGRYAVDVLEERYKVKQLLLAKGLTYYDPAENEGLEKLSRNTVICNAFNLPRMTEFIKKDLAAVAQCRTLLNITGDLPSEGSTWEMAYATFYRQIPVFIVAPKRLSGAKMTFTNVCVDRIFNTIEEAVNELKGVIQCRI